MSAVLVESGRFQPAAAAGAVGGRPSLTADQFAGFLARLDPDPNRAADEYERLRRALVKFFDWRGIASPDECADEVFDRFARKLATTVVEDVSKYVYGIARLVVLERRRTPVFSRVDDLPPLLLTAPESASGTDGLRDCFDRCLASLPDDGRRVLLEYYEGERSAKIANRRRLATLLNVSESALRNRVQRLRDRLEQCVHGCSTQVNER